MKKIIRFFAAAAAATAILSSCSVDSNDPPREWFSPNMLVTIKSAADGQIYLQLDEKTTLLPVNIKGGGYKTPSRALAYCEASDKPSGAYDKAVVAHWLEPMLTKAAVATEGSASADDKKYGNDPVEIADSWMTVVEDGYLTMNFVALFGNSTKPHYVNLVTGSDPSDPYTVVFRHDANGDREFAQRRSGMVAFDLSSLPDTKGEKVKLTVKYQGFEKEKSMVFDYCSK